MELGRPPPEWHSAVAYGKTQVLNSNSTSAVQDPRLDDYATLASTCLTSNFVARCLKQVYLHFPITNDVIHVEFNHVLYYQYPDLPFHEAKILCSIRSL